MPALTNLTEHRNCKECNSPFLTSLWLIARGQGIFCNIKCKRAWDKMTPEDFWGMMTKTENCWVWNGRKNPAGYGTLEFNKKTMLAHRLAWKLTNGEIPTKMQVCHHCDNPPCCNPKHLFLGTDQDNRTDMVNKGRSLYGARQPISKLTDDQTLEIRRLYRETDLLYKDIAKMFGISKSHVGHICLRKSWKHLP